LRQGSNGDLVATLQTVLNEGRGDFSPDSDPPLLVDGDFGPKTAAAVEGTQALAEAVVDGVVGFQTWALPVHAMGQVIADLCGVTGPGSS
jgi:peptidoglycan hydrolase-like protein with peptidoglycan-binding domain